jgi:hypothetical protein
MEDEAVIAGTSLEHIGVAVCSQVVGNALPVRFSMPL